MRKTLDYAILGSLAHEPRSGYDLTKWLSVVASHFWPVGHSSIYPALAALEADGLVRHETLPSGQGPDRKVYSLTARGRDELLAWVDGPPPESQPRDEQLVQALCYGLLPQDRALARLARVREAHADRLAHYETLERRLRAGGNPDGDRHGVAGPALTGTLLVLRRGILNERSYLQWCDEAREIILAAHAARDTDAPPPP